VATRRVSKNLQQGRAGGEGTGYRGDNTSPRKSRDTVQPRSRVFLLKSFRGQATGWDALQIVYILKFKRSTDKDEGFLEVKEAEANEQHQSIISMLKAAAPKWEFEQIKFVVGNHGSVVENDFYTKLKKLDVKEGKKRSSSPIM